MPSFYVNLEKKSYFCTLLGEAEQNNSFAYIQKYQIYKSCNNH